MKRLRREVSTCGVVTTTEIVNQILNSIKQKQDEIVNLHQKLVISREEESQLITSAEALVAAIKLDITVPKPIKIDGFAESSQSPTTSKSTLEKSPSKKSCANEVKEAEEAAKVQQAKEEPAVPQSAKGKEIATPELSSKNKWHLAAPHVTGKNVAQPSFETEEAAQKAFEEFPGQTKVQHASFKEAVQKPATRKTTFRNNSFGDELRKRISAIPTTAQIQELRKPRRESFAELHNTLVKYDENQALKGFYLTNRGAGYKAFFLPGADSWTIYQYYIHGLTHYIVLENMKGVEHFSSGFQTAVKTFYFRVAKSKPVFLRTVSSYPIFDEEGKLLVPSLAVINIGVFKEGSFPPKDLGEKELQIKDYVRALASVYYSCRRLGRSDPQEHPLMHVKINYANTTTLIYSRFNQSLDKKGEQALLSFEGMFHDFTGSLEPLPEEYKRLLCESIRVSPTHRCRHCLMLPGKQPLPNQEAELVYEDEIVA